MRSASSGCSGGEGDVQRLRCAAGSGVPAMSWPDLLTARLSRRWLFRAAALGTVAAPLRLRAAQRRTTAAKERVPFAPLPPSTADELLVARGFRQDVVLRWGDDLGNGTFATIPTSRPSCPSTCRST